MRDCQARSVRHRVRAGARPEQCEKARRKVLRGSLRLEQVGLVRCGSPQITRDPALGDPSLYQIPGKRDPKPVLFRSRERTLLSARRLTLDVAQSADPYRKCTRELPIIRPPLIEKQHLANRQRRAQSQTISPLTGGLLRTSFR